MVVWSDWLSHIASALGTSTSQAGIFMSLIFTLGVIISVLIVTKGHKAESTIPLISVVILLIFTFLGWFPLWTGTILGFVFALFIALKIGKGLG